MTKEYMMIYFGAIIVGELITIVMLKWNEYNWS